MAETLDFKYRAFISYSHADTAWAKWLHRALEGFRIDKDLVGRETETGTIPKTLRPIFRDRDDFTAGHTLTGQTLAALDASPALIVLCSPRAANSDYVTEEIRLFKSRHPERPVIPLIVDGTPGDAENECFPRSLRFALDDDGQITDQPLELLAADARDEGDGKQLALAKVVAGLLGVSSDDIFRRAMRERRRKGRVRNGVIAVLAFLAIAATGSAVYAWQQLKTNEAFLDATLERFTSLVDRSVSLADNYAVPAKVTLGFLEEAEGMLDVMAAYGRDTPKMKYRKAVMLRAFADNYAALGQTGAWQARIDEAQALMAELVASDPANAEWSWEKGLGHERKGLLLQAKGDVEGALREYRAYRDIILRLAEAYPDNAGLQRDLSVSYNKVGNVLVAQGDLAGARQAYRDGLGIRERLAGADPGNAGWQRDLSVSYNKAGDVLLAQGDLAAALKAYQSSLDTLKRIAETDPENVGWQRHLSVSYNRMGDVLVAQGDLKGARQAYRDGLGIAERLTQADPGNAGWQRDLSVSYDRIGNVLVAQGDLAGAYKAYSDGLGIVERLTQADPGNAGWQRHLSVSYIKVGDVLVAQGDLAGAKEAHEDSLGIAERLAQADPGNAGWQRDLAVSHGRVASVLAQSGEISEAREGYRRAREIIAKLIAASPGNAALPKDLAWYDARIAALEAAEAGPATPPSEPAAP